jgi:hypothetical protein
MHMGKSEGQCPHLEFSFNIRVARMEDTNIKYAEVTGRCLNCDGIARFRGMNFGCTPAHPTMAIDGSDANLPFLVGDEEYDGKAMGFVGRQTA